MIDAYTRLLEVAAQAEDQATADLAVTKLIAHLKAVGRLKMLPQIAQELRKVAARRHSLQPHVEVAHLKEAPAALRAAGEAGIHATHTQVNTALIHGWRARSHGVLIDRSAKRALLTIYQKVTV